MPGTPPTIAGPPTNKCSAPVAAGQDSGQALITAANEVLSFQQQLEKQLHEEELRLARTSLPHFLEYVMRDSSSGEYIKLADVHKSWCDHIAEYFCTEYDIGILSCWGFGKSSIVAIGLPLFLIGNNRNIRIGLVCNADTNASKRVNSISEYILKSERYHEVFPDVKPGKNQPWNDHRIVVERTTIAPEGTVEAYGIDSSGTGSRFDVLIYDDPIDIKDAESEATRTARIEKINNVWTSRVEERGKSFWIATRWHKHDANHEMLQKENWKFIIQAVSDDFESIVEPPAEYRHYATVIRRENPRQLHHWDGKWTKDALKERCARLGLRSFNRGLRQRPYSDEDVLFSTKSIEDACAWNLGRDSIPLEWPRYLGADLSSDKRPGTAIVVIARDPRSGKKHLVEIQRGNWGWSARTANKIVELFDRHKCRLGFVENNAAQETMLELIRTLHRRDLPIKGYTTGKQKADPTEGLPGLAVEFENGIWRIPLLEVAKEKKYLASSEVPEIVLIRELMEYPNGSQSDTVMGLWFASAASKSGVHLAIPGIYTGGSGQGRAFSGYGNKLFGNGYGSSRTF